MKAAVKAEWTADLRANPDAQGVALLDYIDDNGKRKQCCLGRLCLLAVKAGVIPPPEMQGSTYYYLDDSYNELGIACGESFSQSGTLPRKVEEWAGLDRDNPVILPEESPDNEFGHALAAADANDEYRWTYAEIADTIDAHVTAE